MQPENNTQVIGFSEWTLRVRSAQSKRKMLLLIHGLKGDENSMWIFANKLSPDYWVIAPRAPYRVQDGGYSWYPTEAADFDHLSRDEVNSIIERLVKLVEDYQSTMQFDEKGIDVAGFSQGAALALLLALSHPALVRKTAILAGFIPDHAKALISSSRLNDKPFFVAHGQNDQTVPIERGREAAALLGAAGGRVTFCEAEVSHKVSASCLRALKEYFGE